VRFVKERKKKEGKKEKREIEVQTDLNTDPSEAHVEISWRSFASHLAGVQLD
jgi:hypothetical protein